jgi:hypothetical protein
MIELRTLGVVDLPAPDGRELFAMHNELHPAIRLWLLARVSLRLGDVAGRGELSRMAVQDNPMVRSLDVETRAEVPRGGKAGPGGGCTPSRCLRRGGLRRPRGGIARSQSAHPMS